MSDAQLYAHKVQSGDIVAGKYVRQACQRFLDDLKRGDVRFNEKEANKAVNFIERYLCQWEGSWRGKPFKLELWQKFIVQQIFGWFKGDSRRIRTVYVQIARKNGKTSFAAAIALYHLFCDRENTPQILVGANNEDQAKICVNSAGRIIENSPVLAEYLEEGIIALSRYRDKIFSISHRERDGVISAMSKEPGTKHGFNPSMGIIDEYHEADTDELLTVIETGQGSRLEPLLFAITTAGFKKDGPCYMKLRHSSVEILAGVKEDDGHLAFIYEPDEGDSIYDQSTWIKSNPNLGVSVFPAFLQNMLTKAKNEGGSKEVDVTTLNFNTWCDAPIIFIGKEIWDKNRCGISPEMLEGRVCYGGLDLAAGVDINAWCLLFPQVKQVIDMTGKLVWVHAALWRFWIPDRKVLEKQDRVDYRLWANQGHIKVCPGNVVDHDQVAADIIEDSQKYRIHSVAFDSKLANVSGIIKKLVDSGIECNPFGQGIMSVSEPTKEMERLIYNYQFEHFGNPVMNWMISNTVPKKDAIGNMRLDKEASREKIDGVAAMVNATAQAMTFEWNIDGNNDAVIETW